MNDYATSAISASPEKPLSPNERNTLLTIIAALCGSASINHQGRGVAAQIVRMVETMGARMDEDTVRRALAKIPDALESRMK